MQILRKRTEDVYPGLEVTDFAQTKNGADVYAYEGGCYCACHCSGTCQCYCEDPDYSVYNSPNGQRGLSENTAIAENPCVNYGYGG